MISTLLFKPKLVFFSAVILALVSLLFQGTLFDIYTLSKEKVRIEKRYNGTVERNEELQKKINQARHSYAFIGRQAREKLDLLGDDELVFIFEGSEWNETLHVNPGVN